MKVLVTGAAGLLGSEVVPALAANHDVRCQGTREVEPACSRSAARTRVSRPGDEGVRGSLAFSARSIPSSTRSSSTHDSQSFR